jgi:hypothetical protein
MEQMGNDAFEQQYLSTGEDVVHREKVAYRGAFALVGALSIIALFFSLVGFAAAFRDPSAALGGVLFLLLSGALALASVAGSVLRTIVTTRTIVLHAGVTHEKRIPLAEVTGVALTKYDNEARRRGIAEGRGAFIAIHPKHESVRIEWTGADGVGHVAYVASDAPEALAELLRSAAARARGEGRGTGVRVEGSPSESEPARDELTQAAAEGEAKRLG